MTKPYRILNGNCLDLMKTLEDNSVDSIVTDPPYGLSEQPDIMKVLECWMRSEDYRQGKGFMGKEWDSFVPGPAIWREVYRVLKPGGHVLAFSGTRTYDLTVLAVRMAGFEIRDMISWVYGSGMPKSHNIGKAIDAKVQYGKSNSVALTKSEKTRPVVGEVLRVVSSNRSAKEGDTLHGVKANMERFLNTELKNIPVTAPATPEAAQWEGWGTALKPSLEPVVLARKPLGGTVAENVLRHGTGGLNIDGCRVEYLSEDDKASATPQGKCTSHDESSIGAKPNIGQSTERITFERPEQRGRWPANFIHDGSDEVLDIFPITKSIASKTPHEAYEGEGVTGMIKGRSDASNQRDDEGSAARFFYCAKASKSDRDEGLEDLTLTPSYMVQNGSKTSGTPDGVRWERKTMNHNPHPTVKPTSLMSYLCRLITPPGGLVLDPFMGSGSTGKAAMLEGFQFIGMDMDAEYCEVAKTRLEHALKSLEKPLETKKKSPKKLKDEDITEDIPSLFDL